MTGQTGTPDTVAAQVNAQTTDARVRLALLMAPFLEGGGSSPLGASGWGVGDNGHSFGPYQINLPFHPSMNAQSATDPAQAVRYMLPAYTNAVNAQPASLWQTNPERAAEQAIQAAENPATDYYSSHGAASVHSAYLSAQAAVGNAGAGGPSGPVLGPPTGLPTGTPNADSLGSLGPLGPLTPFGLIPGLASGSLGGAASSVAGSLLGPVERFLANGVLIILGVIIAIVALVLLAKSSLDDHGGQTVVLPASSEADAAAGA